MILAEGPSARLSSPRSTGFYALSLPLYLLGLDGLVLPQLSLPFSCKAFDPGCMGVARLKSCSHQCYGVIG